ncbi:MAG TPA: NifU family protein [Candidatus Pelethenecus faecipullorum]|uniref:NifU family protein n=1 Tax=Candidatus Pelethenecus faecipullorum TaxID=2840900 RepID=A0A9D1KK17_9MOLU|nr:NifU family protein [Candidatus Pelethenecus faecipullorum]
MDQIETQIIKILDKIRPYLNSEGGDLEYIGFKDGIVYIRMLGACMDCIALDSTLKDGIESLLIENIPEVIEVKNVAEGVDLDGISF